jgi:hypothetical protein
MQDRIAELEARLASVERRLSALEGPAPDEVAIEPAGDEPALDESFIANASGHIGRVLLIFGGAYLLRAVTDFGFVATAVGLTMGASYALYWLFMAWRKAASATHRANAAFFGATSVFLALPLLVESSTTFALLSGRQALLALVLFTILAYGIAATRRLRSLAWLVTVGATLTALALLIVFHEAVLVSLFLLALGLASLWIVYGRDWMALQWLGAVGANGGVVALIGLSRSEQWQLDPSAGLWLGTCLLLAYFLSFAMRTHRMGRNIGAFETVQALLAAAVAFSAAYSAARVAGDGLAGIGALSLVLAVCAYALALTRRSRELRGPNFFYYTSLGLVFVIAGTALVLPGPAAATVWSLLALLAAWQSGRRGWVSLSLQCTLLLVAAAAGSGILGSGLKALAGDATAAWPEASAVQIGVALTTVACLFIPVAQRSIRWGSGAGIPQVIVLVLSVWEVGGLFVILTAPLIAGAGGSEPNLAVLAALRTAVLSVASVTLALSSRFARWPEARWLVYPLLVVVGIKLFAEDFPHGQAATLFVALAFVGSALLLTARLLKRDRPPPSRPSRNVQANTEQGRRARKSEAQGE